MVFKYLILLIILAIFSGIKGDRYHFMYKAIGYQNHDPVMNALKNATYRELGLKLDVQDKYKSLKLNEVTACLEVSLSYVWQSLNQKGFLFRKSNCCLPQLQKNNWTSCAPGHS